MIFFVMFLLSYLESVEKKDDDYFIGWGFAILAELFFEFLIAVVVYDVFLKGW